MPVRYISRTALAAKQVQTKMDAVARKGAMDILAQSRARVPVDTGYLKGSSNMVTPAPHTFAVVYHARYAVFQELGTRNMGAQPFLRPAFDLVKPSIIAAWKKTIATGGLR